jgi:oligopeptide/dipeptide ABC transporter ATP-binding protein
VKRPGSALLEVEGIRAGYGPPSRAAVLDGVALKLGSRESLGLVGESGSGKTTLARVLLRLLPPQEGEIRFDGQDWLRLREGELRRVRWKMQAVFQDSRAALNPRRNVADAIAEPFDQRFRARAREREERVRELLGRVGLPPEAADRYPHEFSGGERQRIAIARALACEPKLLICDEPVSHLDAPVKAEIESLLADVREREGTALIVISHDLPAVARLADRIAVLLAGRVVEEGPADDLLSDPRHPLTAMMVAASESAASASLEPARGCQFSDRCPVVTAECRQHAPGLSPDAGDRSVACYHPGSYRGF